MLTVLTTQSAWAVSGSTLFDNDSEQSHKYSQAVDQHDEAADSCSHFCHASAHMLGLFSDVSYMVALSTQRHAPQLFSIQTLIKYQPPTPPPTMYS